MRKTLIAALAAITLAATPAFSQHWHGGGYGHSWHGGHRGGGWGPAVGLGILGLGALGAAGAYGAYGPPPYG